MKCGVRPDHGGRLELKLVEASAESARYLLTIFTPTAEATAPVAVARHDGAIVLGEWDGPPPPEWLAAVAHALLRTLWRNQNSDGEWPRRVTRWRPDPKS